MRWRLQAASARWSSNVARAEPEVRATSRAQRSGSFSPDSARRVASRSGSSSGGRVGRRPSPEGRAAPFRRPTPAGILPRRELLQRSWVVIRESRYPLIVSSADGWDLTVPEDAAELLAELRRHGVRPGQRLHVVRAGEEPEPSSGEDAARPPRAKLDFIGSVHGDPADLSTRTDEYLQRGFGRA